MAQIWLIWNQCGRIRRKNVSLNLAFNLFDILLGAALGFGLVQGRKRGMSREWIGSLKWLAILVAGAVIYQPLGQMLAGLGVLSLVSCCLIVYLGIALVIFVLFALVEPHLRKKLEGSDYFGRAEYYLGMASGLVRVSCIVLVTLALLNARSFSPAEVKASEAYQDSAYGTHLFPTLYSVQVGVFEKSMTGPWIKQDLGFLLINPGQEQLQAKK